MADFTTKPSMGQISSVFATCTTRWMWRGTRAYGWKDLADTAAPDFLTEDSEQDHRYHDRLFWPAPFREEVLTRLLALNSDRAADERARGLALGRAETKTHELEDA